MKKYTLQTFADKADYEGGVLEFILGYGVSASEIANDELRKLVTEVLKIQPILDKIQALLPEPSGMGELEDEDE